MCVCACVNIIYIYMYIHDPSRACNHPFLPHFNFTISATSQSLQHPSLLLPVLQHFTVGKAQEQRTRLRPFLAHWALVKLSKTGGFLKAYLTMPIKVDWKLFTKCYYDEVGACPVRPCPFSIDDLAMESMRPAHGTQHSTPVPFNPTTTPRVVRPCIFPLINLW